LLLAKTDANNAAVTYAYDLAGRRSTRTWARGVVTTYAYDPASGDLTGTSYSDGTPAVSNTYDRRGRLATVVDGSGSRSFTYTASGQVAEDTITYTGEPARQWAAAPSAIKTDESLTTAGIGEILGQLLRGIVHRHAAAGEDRVHLKPGQTGQLRGLPEAQDLLRVKGGRQLQPQAGLDFRGRHPHRPGHIIGDFQRHAHGRGLARSPAEARSSSLYPGSGACS
jgi:YD repeat-containing protein